MSSQEQILPQESDELSPDEQYVEIPEWHHRILEELMARYDAEGFIGRPWEEIKQELMNG